MSGCSRDFSTHFLLPSKWWQKNSLQLELSKLNSVFKRILLNFIFYKNEILQFWNITCQYLFKCPKFTIFAIRHFCKFETKPEVGAKGELPEAETLAVPLNKTHSVVVRGLIWSEVPPECVNEESSTERCITTIRLTDLLNNNVKTLVTTYKTRL